MSYRCCCFITYTSELIFMKFGEICQSLLALLISWIKLMMVNSFLYGDVNLVCICVLMLCIMYIDVYVY